MTDKTIINSVDVSECEGFVEFDGTVNDMDICLDNLDKCEMYPNCYYKQSARKDERIRELEEENKSLRQFYKNLTMQGDHLSASQLDAVVTIGYSMGANTYVAENRELKQKLSQIAELCNEINDRDFKCPLPINCNVCEQERVCREQFQKDREIYFKKVKQIKQIAEGKND